MEKTRLKGAMLTFIVLQMCYLFFFFIEFPDSFRNALSHHYDAAAAVGSWLSTVTMLGYCVICLASVAMLVMRKSGFLLWFQVSAAIALIGNFAVYILRQVSGDDFYGYYTYRSTDYYWVLFILALFWAVIWCLYFVRSSRVFSYMGEDDTYLRKGLFTKNVPTPAPWVDPAQQYPMYPPNTQRPPQPPYAPQAAQPQPQYQPPRQPQQQAQPWQQAPVQQQAYQPAPQQPWAPQPQQSYAQPQAAPGQAYAPHAAPPVQNAPVGQPWAPQPPVQQPPAQAQPPYQPPVQRPAAVPPPPPAPPEGGPFPGQPGGQG